MNLILLTIFRGQIKLANYAFLFDQKVSKIHFLQQIPKESLAGKISVCKIKATDIFMTTKRGPSANFLYSPVLSFLNVSSFFLGGGIRKPRSTNCIPCFCDNRSLQDHASKFETYQIKMLNKSSLFMKKINSFIITKMN